MSGFFDLTSIIFLVIAIAVFVRLGSVLGRRTGNEPRLDPAAKRVSSTNDNVLTLPRSAAPAGAPASGPDLARLRAHVEPGSTALDGLSAIAAADPQFDIDHFLDGAKAAYEMVRQAYANGDRAALRALLAPDLLKGFEDAIAAREAAEETSEETFVGDGRATVTEAALDERTARITVRFLADVISVDRARDGSIVRGDPEAIVANSDSWTFARDTSQRDPNWTVVSTGED